MIAGLIRPTSGDVFVNEARMTDVPVHRRNIGMLFQNYALFPHLTVEENIAFGLEMRGIAKAGAAKKVGAKKVGGAKKATTKKAAGTKKAGAKKVARRASATKKR